MAVNSALNKMKALEIISLGSSSLSMVGAIVTKTEALQHDLILACVTCLIFYLLYSTATSYGDDAKKRLNSLNNLTKQIINTNEKKIRH